VSKVAITAVVRELTSRVGCSINGSRWSLFKVTAGQRAFQEVCSSYMIKLYHLFLMSEYILDISKKLKYNTVNNSFGHDILSSDVFMY